MGISLFTNIHKIRFRWWRSVFSGGNNWHVSKGARVQHLSNSVYFWKYSEIPRHCVPCLSFLWFTSPSSFAPDPCVLSCNLSETLWSCSLSVSWTDVPVDLCSTALATFSRKAFLSSSILLWNVRACVCGGVSWFVYDRGVWVNLFERAVKAGVTGETVLCWPSSFSDFSPPQVSRIKRQDAVVDSAGVYEDAWVKGWSGVYLTLRVYCDRLIVAATRCKRHRHGNPVFVLSPLFASLLSDLKWYYTWCEDRK